MVTGTRVQGALLGRLASTISATLIAAHLRKRRDGADLSAARAAATLRDVTEHDIENFERRGAPQSIVPLAAYLLCLYAEDKDIAAIPGASASALSRVDNRTLQALGKRREALLLGQFAVPPLLSYPVSRPYIARLERGEVSISAQKFLRYAVRIGADLRAIAELVSVTPTKAVNTAAPYPTNPLAAMRAAARLGRLRDVLAIATQALDEPERAPRPGLTPKLLFTLSIAFALERRWGASQLFAEAASQDPRLDHLNLLRARIQSAWVFANRKRTLDALQALADLRKDAQEHGPELHALVEFHHARLLLLLRNAPAASQGFARVIKLSSDPDLRFSALAKRALAAAHEKNLTAVKRSIGEAPSRERDADPPVVAFRMVQLARAARLVGLMDEAEDLARAAVTLAERQASPYTLLRARVELLDLALERKQPRSARTLEQQVMQASRGLYLERWLALYCRRVIERVAAGRSHGR